VFDTLNSFYRVNGFDAGVDFSTQLFGFFKPLPALFGTKVDMIRHVFQPTVGFSWSPDFGGFEPAFTDRARQEWQYFGTYYRPIPYSTEYTEVPYGYFDGNVFGGASRGSRGNINLSVGNNLEMKVTSQKDTTGYRKISLIDNLSASASYNAFADSLNWSDISTSMRLKLTRNVSVTINANFTPYVYQLDQFQNPAKMNITEWEKNGRLARMTRVGTSFGYSFSNDMFRKKTSTKDEKKEKPIENKQQSEFDEEGYLIFKMPWNFRFDYSISYFDYQFNRERLEFDKKTNQTLGFSGNVTFSKNWQFNFSSGYDFDAKKIAYTSCGITRDLHCWTASLNLIPFGVNSSYFFVIRVKSSLLQDLKYEKQSDPSVSPMWF